MKKVLLTALTCVVMCGSASFCVYASDFLGVVASSSVVYSDSGNEIILRPLEIDSSDLSGIENSLSAIHTNLLTFLNTFYNFTQAFKFQFCYYFVSDKGNSLSYTDLTGQQRFYQFPAFISYDPSYTDEQLQYSAKHYYCSYPGAMGMYARDFTDLMLCLNLQFFNWFYPLKASEPLYWRYYNTDTGKQESINLAGLMYNISWYLGQMYQMNSWDLGDSGLSDAVELFGNTADNMKSAEDKITSEVNSTISKFKPKLEFSDSGLIVALSCASGYLNDIYLALGLYGVAITIALILAVCMQFIGYFKYK